MMKNLLTKLYNRRYFVEYLDEVARLCEKYLTEHTVSKVVFEVTETILIEDMQRIKTAMQKIRALGISFLSSLREMPIDELKVNRSFVTHLGAQEQESDKIMITTILSIAKIFNLKTVAEGVETKEQLAFLLKNGCDIFQGYYFSKPLAQKDFEDFYVHCHSKRSSLLD